MNSGSVLPLLSFCTWRDLRLALKSNLPGWGTSVGLGLSIELLTEIAGETISGISSARARGLAAGSGGGDFALTEGGGDFDLTGGGDFSLTGGGDFDLIGGGDFDLIGVGVDSALMSRDETDLIGSYASNCLVGELLRDNRFLLSSVIHDGCVEVATGAAGFSSDLVNADSSQLDLVGLHLLFGLDGDDGSAES